MTNIPQLNLYIKMWKKVYCVINLSNTLNSREGLLWGMQEGN